MGLATTHPINISSVQIKLKKGNIAEGKACTKTIMISIIKEKWKFN